MTRVVVIGDVMVDVVVHLDTPIVRGSDAPARISLGGGGSAANVAAWLAAAGAAPVLVSRVGADARGQEERAALVATGVDVRFVTDFERPTGTCVVIVEPDGERTMMPDPGANDTLAPENLPLDLFAAGAHLHWSGYALLRSGSRPAARSALASALRQGMTVSVDPSSAALLSPAFFDLAAGAGLLVPNAEEARVLTGEGDPELAARRLTERFAEVVVTLGREGALWSDGKALCRVPAVEGVTVRDSTGAGDAFAAGLIAARLDGASPELALLAGCRLAARAVVSPGGRPRAL